MMKLITSLVFVALVGSAVPQTDVPDPFRDKIALIRALGKPFTDKSASREQIMNRYLLEITGAYYLGDAEFDNNRHWVTGWLGDYKTKFNDEVAIKAWWRLRVERPFIMPDVAGAERIPTGRKDVPYIYKLKEHPSNVLAKKEINSLLKSDKSSAFLQIVRRWQSPPFDRPTRVDIAKELADCPPKWKPLLVACMAEFELAENKEGKWLALWDAEVKRPNHLLMVDVVNRSNQGVLAKRFRSKGGH